MNYTKVFNNAKWIVICKIVQSLLQLAVGMLSARYLGPSNYGLIKYAASVAAFVLPFMKLGLDATLVHELVENPNKEGEIIGTSLFMNTASSLACICAVTAFSSVTNADEPTTVLVCVLYSISLIFAAFEMIQYWFQYKLMSKHSSLVMLGSYCIVFAYKAFLLISSKSVYWFAFSNSLEYGVIAVLLYLIYFKNGGRLSFSFDRMKSMLNKSKHYIFSSLMIVVIQNTDHIMLTSISGNSENGFYSAAITCVSVAQFVYYAIVDSFRPVILENKKENSEEYKRNISSLYGIIIYLAIAQGAFFSVFADLIVNILYGNEYAAAIPVLRILVWFFIFSIMGVVRNVWILAEQKQKYLWVINLSGALFNVVMNALLIPEWGACGAAFASLLTQFFTNFVLGFIIKPLRENNRMILQGINPKFMLKEGKKLLVILKQKKNSQSNAV